MLLWQLALPVTKLILTIWLLFGVLIKKKIIGTTLAIIWISWMMKIAMEHIWQPYVQFITYFIQIDPWIPILVQRTLIHINFLKLCIIGSHWEVALPLNAKKKQWIAILHCSIICSQVTLLVLLIFWDSSHLTFHQEHLLIYPREVLCPYSHLKSWKNCANAFLRFPL